MHFPHFLQRRTRCLMLQIAYNQLAGQIDLWVMLEGNVEVIFSIRHTGLSWRARNSPWNLHPTEKWLLVQLSCSNAFFLVYADPCIYVTSSHIGTSMSFPSSASQQRVALAMVPKVYLQQLSKCYKESLILIWESPVQEGSFCKV